MARTDTRQIIEQAAIAVLAEYGLDGFSAARLAEFAGLSKANLYHHYASLDEIMLASFERLVGGMQMMHPPVDMGFESWLTGLGEELIALPPPARAATRAYLAYFTRALGDQKLKAAVISSIEGAHAKLAEILQRWQPEAGSHPDAAQLARLILVAGDGFLLHAQMLGDRSGELRPAWALFVDAISQREKSS